MLRLSERLLTPQRLAPALRATPLLPGDGSDQEKRGTRHYPRRHGSDPLRSLLSDQDSHLCWRRNQPPSDPRYPSWSWGWIPWVLPSGSLLPSHYIGWVVYGSIVPLGPDETPRFRIAFIRASGDGPRSRTQLRQTPGCANNCLSGGR